MTTGKTIALTRWTLVGKVMSSIEKQYLLGILNSRCLSQGQAYSSASRLSGMTGASDSNEVYWSQIRLGGEWTLSHIRFWVHNKDHILDIPSLYCVNKHLFFWLALNYFKILSISAPTLVAKCIMSSQWFCIVLPCSPLPGTLLWGILFLIRIEDLLEIRVNLRPDNWGSWKSACCCC